MTSSSSTQTRRHTSSASSDVFLAYDVTTDAAMTTATAAPGSSSLDSQNNPELTSPGAHHVCFTLGASSAAVAATTGSGTSSTSGSLSSTSGFVSTSSVSGSSSLLSRQGDSAELSDWSPISPVSLGGPDEQNPASPALHAPASTAPTLLQPLSDVTKTTTSAPSGGGGEKFRSWLAPNVSLSPVAEHEPRSLSSVSSGRNNSFDDYEVPPTLAANVLLVSHGGLITQACRLFKRLGASIEGCFIKPPPNASICKFVVTVNGSEATGSGQQNKAQVATVSLHDVCHLDPLMGCGGGL